MDTIENQMVLAIEKQIDLSSITDTDLEQLLHFCLTQAELSKSVVIDESKHK